MMTTEQQREHRAQAEREANDDLAKDARHLLYDVHDELIRFDREPIERLSHAQKRLASLTVKNAEAADAVAKRLETLNKVLVWLTVVITASTLVLIFLELRKHNLSAVECMQQGKTLR